MTMPILVMGTHGVILPMPCITARIEQAEKVVHVERVGSSTRLLGGVSGGTYSHWGGECGGCHSLLVDAPCVE